MKDLPGEKESRNTALRVIAAVYKHGHDMWLEVSDETDSMIVRLSDEHSLNVDQRRALSKNRDLIEMLLDITAEQATEVSRKILRTWEERCRPATGTDLTPASDMLNKAHDCFMEKNIAGFWFWSLSAAKEGIKICEAAGPVLEVEKEEEASPEQEKAESKVQWGQRNRGSR